MTVDGAVVPHFFNRTTKVLLGEVVLSEAVIDVSKRVEESAVLRLLIDGRADVFESFVKTGAVLREHVPEIVERHRVSRIFGEHSTEGSFCQVVALLPFVQ